MSIDHVIPEDVLREVEQKAPGAVTAVHAVLPGMRKRGSGSVLFTIGSSALYPVLASGTVGVTAADLRSYVPALHQALAAERITARLALIDLLIALDGCEADAGPTAKQAYRLHLDRNRTQGEDRQLA